MELSVANATAAFEMVLSPGAGIASAAGKSALRARVGGDRGEKAMIRQANQARQAAFFFC